MEKELLITRVLRENPVLSTNKDLLCVVEDYFLLALRTQKLYASLQNSVKKARDDQIIIDRALAVQEPQILLSEEIIDKLRIFKPAAGSGLICVEEFRTVYVRHVEMQSKLGVVKRKLVRKLKYFKRLMKSCSVATGLVNRFVSLYTQPRLQDLCDGNRWLKSIGIYTSQQHLVEHLNLGTFLICKDMETMKALVDLFEGELGRIPTIIEFWERHGNYCATEQIRNKRCEIFQQLEEFERQIDICKTRTVVLQKLSTRRNPLMEGHSVSVS